MAQVDAEKAKAMMIRMKADIRALLEKYASEASAISVNSDDPHTPVLGCLQMALANASADYLAFCGVLPNECFNLVVNVTGQGMQQWINAVLKHHGAKVQEVPAEKQ